MRPIRSATLGVFASAVLATSLAGCQLDPQSRSASDIVVAADLELSGPSASTGNAYKRALQLRVEQINSSGVLGERRIRLEITDNKSDPAESLRNVSEITKDPKVKALVLGSCSECAVNAAKVIDDQKVPTVALAPASAVADPG
ncbi:MAG TPA: ABC transporter substrate-binding protein, partial [Micromonospora sp.]